MPTSYEQLRDAVLALSPVERLELADNLAVSLRRSDDDLKLTPEFINELRRRSAELDEDPSAGFLWEEVRAEMMKPVPA